MAGENDDVPFELTARLLDKMDFAPGVPDDPDAVPSLYYQALLGNVYTLQRWKDGSTVRGEVPLADLEALTGGSLREGWYSASGQFLGATIELD
jgi:hypothetical protein